MHNLKTLALTAALIMGALTPVQAEPVKIGLLGDLSGKLATMTPSMVEGAQIAFDHINDNGGLLGEDAELIVHDSACDSVRAVSAASKLINDDKASVLIGPYCSGALLAVAQKVGIAASIPMLSPSARALEIAALEDNDLIFRLTSSEDYEPKRLAESLVQTGISPLAVTHLKRPSAKKFARAFQDAYQKAGGVLQRFAAHEGEKNTYQAELDALAGLGPKNLLIIDYGSGSGATLLRQAAESNFFDKLIGNSTIKSVNLANIQGLDGFMVFDKAASNRGASFERFSDVLESYGGRNDRGLFVAESYDAAFLTALAIQSSGTTKGAEVSKHLRMITSGEGEPILPGEWEKALALLEEGKAIHYHGASGAYTFNQAGDYEPPMALWVANGNQFTNIMNQ